MLSRQEKAHMFEHHEVVDEEDALALEQFPDGLSSLALGLRQWLYVILFGHREQIGPVRVLQQWRQLRHNDGRHSRHINLRYIHRELN